MPNNHKRTYICPACSGEILTSIDRDGHTWVSLTGANNPDFYAGILPKVYAEIESRYGLSTLSSQDFPLGTDGFNQVVIYDKSVDTLELATLIKELIENEG